MLNSVFEAYECQKLFKSLHSSSFTLLPFLIDPRGGCVKHKPANSFTNVSAAVLGHFRHISLIFFQESLKCFPSYLCRACCVLCEETSVFRNVMLGLNPVRGLIILSSSV